MMIDDFFDSHSDASEEEKKSEFTDIVKAEDSEQFKPNIDIARTRGLTMASAIITPEMHQ